MTRAVAVARRVDGVVIAISVDWHRYPAGDCVSEDIFARLLTVLRPLLRSLARLAGIRP